MLLGAVSFNLKKIEIEIPFQYLVGLAEMKDEGFRYTFNLEKFLILSRH